MTRLTVTGFAIFVVLNFVLAADRSSALQDQPADDPQEKKLTIKDVMKKAHKDGLTKKVALGKATAEEKKKLYEMYKAMAKLKPPKGPEKGWKEKTKKLVEAAKAAVDGEADAGKKLTAASNCKSCHKEHK